MLLFRIFTIRARNILGVCEIFLFPAVSAYVPLSTAL